MSSSLTARVPVLPLTEKSSRDGTRTAADELQDEVLLSRLQAGEHDALGCLFERYARIVRGIAVRILRDASEADDLAQDVFLFIQRKCSIFDSSKGSAGSWIVHMTYQRAIERRRYLATRHFYKSTDIHSAASHVVGNPTAENDYSAEAVFGRNGLEKVLGALSKDQRETLRLHFFEGYTLLEISAKLGQPLGNVRHFYYRGLDRLRKQMFGRKVRAS